MAGSSASPSDGPTDALLPLLDGQLQRVWAALQGQPERPHWMALAVVDQHTVAVDATHGASGFLRRDHVRQADLDLRVGTPELDNTHKIRDASLFSDEPRVSLELPLVDSPPEALHLAIWRAADDAYRSAARRLVQVRTNDVVKVAREDPSPDFSAAPVVVDVRPWTRTEIDAEAWRDRVREASAVFLEYPQVFDSNVSLWVQDEIQTFVTSEGTKLRHTRHRMRVAAWAGTVAEDGMELQVYDYVEAASPGRLPDQEALLAMVRGVAQRVTDLRAAPVVEPYVGPAILRGRATAVFFHEVLGHRVEGHRQKDEDEGQTFTDKVGEAVLPPFLSVVDDPTLAEWNGVDLAGHYAYDDEGVAAERVTVIDRGVLKGFLLGRSPIAGFDRSNGHGRRQSGSAVVPRQGNLMVIAHQTVPYDALRKRLIDEIKRQGKPFGLIFDDISGGFTFTGRSTPNSFAVQPVVVWRVYPDGRPDELVRGADLIGTPLVAFGRILAASDSTDVFNGSCGAESGWVPVAAVAPDLLLSEVEVQRTEKANDRPPLLPPPGAPPRDRS